MIKKSILIIVAVVISIALFLWSTNRYPIMIVNWNVVTARQLHIVENGALQFYREALQKFRKDTTLETRDQQTLTREVRRAALEELVGQSLIEHRASAISGINELVASKIVNAIGQKNISKQVQELYGLTIDEFKKYTLTPQAKKEIVSEALQKNGETFKEWIAIRKANARVIVLIPGLSWTDKGIEYIKEE